MKFSALFSLFFFVLPPHAFGLGRSLTGDDVGGPIPDVIKKNDGDDVAASSLPPLASLDPFRSLLSTMTPFQAFNEACMESCDGVERSGTLSPFVNPCPRCGEHYSSQHCSNCCHNGASSLKVRWYGCAGRISFPSNQEGIHDCGLEDFSSEGVRLVDCGCYDDMIATPPATTDCELFDTVDLPALSDTGTGHDLCFVSVQTNPQGDTFVDLCTALPDAIGFTFTPLDSPAHLGLPVLRTYMDVTCSFTNDMPYAFPIFPGYGKFPNSCPKRGFVDLHLPGNAPLPDEIDHYDGKPSFGMFWIEFIDGTSVGFHPHQHEGLYFDWSFATCKCLDCPRNDDDIVPGPTSTPMTPFPTDAPNDGSTGEPTLAPTTESTSEWNYIDPCNKTEDHLTLAPTSAPTSEQTGNPTEVPSPSPVAPSTETPTVAPTVESTLVPTEDPTPEPTFPPTFIPTDFPTKNPTDSPSDHPTALPSGEPTDLPTSSPTFIPTDHPTNDPTNSPSNLPTSRPTTSPTGHPTIDPTSSPTFNPTSSPTNGPTFLPTLEPTYQCDCPDFGGFTYELDHFEALSSEFGCNAYHFHYRICRCSAGQSLSHWSIDLGKDCNSNFVEGSGLCSVGKFTYGKDKKCQKWIKIFKCGRLGGEAIAPGECLDMSFNLTNVVDPTGGLPTGLSKPGRACFASSGCLQGPSCGECTAVPTKSPSAAPTTVVPTENLSTDKPMPTSDPHDCTRPPSKPPATEEPTITPTELPTVAPTFTPTKETGQPTPSPSNGFTTAPTLDCGPALTYCVLYARNVCQMATWDGQGAVMQCIYPGHEPSPPGRKLLEQAHHQVHPKEELSKVILEMYNTGLITKEMIMKDLNYFKDLISQVGG